ncbi:MAG: CinA family nicotinamide mononucleotide deamidase-related protein [Planctomycetales bacterium]
MQAEILAIGTELTTGAKLDTNSQWLSRELSALGLPVLFHTTVADDRQANVDALRIACERVDLVLITGGLGPTLDDLTREVIAEVMGVPLELHEPSLEAIKGMFARRQRPMPERNVVQAMFPKGSEVLLNPNGTAPGIWAEIPREGRGPVLIGAMPGVPSEMFPMFHNEVEPRLKRHFTAGKVIRGARLNCFGLGESHAEELLGDLTKRGRDPEVGITVHEGTITLRIESHGDTAEECERKIEETKRLARERLKQVVYGVEDQELEDVLIPMLNERGVTIASVECGTGGVVAERITRVAGHEQCYKGGLILGATESASLAGAKEFHARLKADYTLYVGEFPLESEGEALTPSAQVALLAGDKVVERQIVLGGDPTILRIRIAKGVLNLLR